MQIDNIHWIWEKSPRRKHIALVIDDNCLLKVKTPLRTSQKKVEALIIEKRSWIEKSLQKQEDRIHPKFPEFSSEGKLYFIGELYDFVVEDTRGSSVMIDGQKISIKAKNETQFKKALQSWYLEHTQKYVERFVEELSIKIKKSPTTIGYRYYKRRWGSCDTQNNMMFNALLSLHKEEHIKYVVAHELAHMKVKNHSKTFYLEGERILSGFRDLDKAMRS